MISKSIFLYGQIFSELLNILFLMKKSSYSEIVTNASITGNKYNDEDFHPNIKIQEDENLLQDVEWKRIEDLYRTPILCESTSMNAIKQGKLGDCHIISALISISQFPDLVSKLFEMPISVESGAICVNFHYLGQNSKIIVDTYLPFHHNHLVLSRPQHPKKDPWWFSIVEKAYAKLFGSYTSLKGGNAHAALYRLIGGWPFAFYFNDQETKELIENGKLFKRMKRWSREGYPMCCGSLESPHKKQKKNKYNICYDHSYSILKVVKIHSHKLIYLRNTWGKSEWSGRWGLNSNVWNNNSRNFKKILDYNQKDDGNFWISYGDFLKYFTSLYVDVVLKDYWHKTGVGGIWNEVSDVDENEFNVDSPSQISIDPKSMHQWLIKIDRPLALKCTFEKVGEKVSCFACLVKNGGKKLGKINQVDFNNYKSKEFKSDESDTDDNNSDEINNEGNDGPNINSNKSEVDSENSNSNDIENVCMFKDSEFFVQNFPKNSEVVSFRWDIEDCSEPWTLALSRQKCNKDTSFYLTIYTVDEIYITSL